MLHNMNKQLMKHSKSYIGNNKSNFSAISITLKSSHYLGMHSVLNERLLLLFLN